jgi:thiol-disulfide isomerase/thioredoxin
MKIIYLFKNSNCLPCRIMTPVWNILKEIYSKELFVSFREVDTDLEESKPLIEKYQVTSAPTFIFVKNCIEDIKLRHFGKIPRPELEKIVHDFIFDAEKNEENECEES